MPSLQPKPRTFRIEHFGSCEYQFNDVVLRNRDETLELLDAKGLQENHKEAMQKLWNGAQEVSLLNLRLPAILQIEYTYKCPLKCKYCYSSSAPNRDETMPFDKFQQLVQRINNEDIFDLYLLGGEPFIFPDYLKYFLGEIQDKFVTISTNGVLITEESCNWIKDSNNSVAISIGVDGHTQEIHDATRGGFYKMLDSLYLLRDHEIPLVATTCVTNHNYNYLEDIIEFLIEQKAMAIQVLPVEGSHLKPETREELRIRKPEEQVRENMRGLIKKYKDRIRFEISFRMPDEDLAPKTDVIYYGPCTAGILSAGINVYGNLVLCPPVPALQIPIESTIENAFLSLKEGVASKRSIFSQEGELAIQQCCSVFGYDQKCAYTR